MSSPSLELCISIISGNNRQMTIDCLQSLIESLTGDLSVEIHFIDNAAPISWFNEVANMSELIIVHRNLERKGFGRNHNEVMSSVDAAFYLLLNDDTIVTKGACESLVAEAKLTKEAAFVGPRLLNGDLTLQRSCYKFPSAKLVLFQGLFLNKLFPSLSWFDDYSEFDHLQRRFVDFVSGAALLVRRDTIQEIGMFDEQFFMYAEETDWCMRAHNSGWKTLFVPSSTIIHFGGQSTINFSKERSVEFLRSHSRLILKHSGWFGLLGFKASCLLKHGIRLILAILLVQKATRIAQELDIVRWSLGLLWGPGLSDRKVNSANLSA